jgi:hypothetical protein
VSRQFCFTTPTKQRLVHVPTPVIWSFVAGACMTCAAFAQTLANEKPSIQITRVSQKEGRIAGLVRGLKPEERNKFKVLVFIKSDVYYPHPYLESYATISETGDWQVEHILRGSERTVAAALIPKNAKLPDLDRQGWVKQLDELRPVAAHELEYQPEYATKPDLAGQTSSPREFLDQEEQEPQSTGSRAPVVIASGDSEAGRIDTFKGRGGTASFQVWQATAGGGAFYEIRFDHGERGYCGWYVDFYRRPIDARNMKALSFYIRGGSGGESVRVGLKDADMSPDSDAILVSVDVLSNEWQKMEVPLASFKKLKTDRVTSFVLEPVRPTKGVIYLDSVQFVGDLPGTKQPTDDQQRSASRTPEAAAARPKSPNPEEAETSQKKSPEAPRLLITSISQRDGKISGLVQGVKDPKSYKVLVFIRTDVYYLHPYGDSFAHIRADGTWEVEHVVRGSERGVAAMLLRKDEKIPLLDRQGYLSRLEQLKQFAAFPDAVVELEYEAEFKANDSWGCEPQDSEPNTTQDDEKAVSAAAEPTIEIAQISAKEGIIRGTVQNLPAAPKDFVVVCYVRSDIWYRHPFAESVASIAEDGLWEIAHVPRGHEGEVGAVVGRRPFNPPSEIGSLDSVKGVVAKTSVRYKPEYRAERRSQKQAKTIAFADRTWEIKAGNRMGPGPNAWSDGNVLADETGRLHLAITEDDGKWYCAELIATEPLGYGEYRWVVSGDLAKLDQQTVLGLFLYRDDRHEIDFELSRWGQAEANNGQFVVQAARNGKHRFDTGDATTITVSIYWNEGLVRGRCWAGEDTTAKPLADWRFESPQVPREESKLAARVNFWLVGGKPPSTGKPQEVVIQSFHFVPARTAPK